MEFNLDVGKYTIRQRTEYSKIQLFDTKTGKNITNGNEEILEKIMNDYRYQSSYPSQYFEIEGDVLKRFKMEVAKGIEYIYIPYGIKKIANYAFEESNICGINFPSTLEQIGEYAFRGCQFLESVNIPNSVTGIGDAAFKDCFRLSSVELSSSMKGLSRHLFDNCGDLKDVNLGNSIILIMSYAFCNCKGLEYIKLPTNCKAIETSVFSGCEKLSKIDFSDALESIGTAAFMSCTSLKEMIIPNNVRNLAGQTFTGCTELEYVKLPESLVSLGEEMFAGCRSLNKVDIPDNVSELSRNIFFNTKKLESIEIPRNFRTIVLPVFARSSISTLIINHDLNYPKDLTHLSLTDHKEMKYTLFNSDLLTESNINKLVIGKDVSHIDDRLFKFSGWKIKDIEYHGTKEEFETLKENNKELFNCLTELKNVSFIDEFKFENVRENNL